MPEAAGSGRALTPQRQGRDDHPDSGTRVRKKAAVFASLKQVTYDKDPQKGRYGVFGGTQELLGGRIDLERASEKLSRGCCARTRPVRACGSATLRPAD